SLTQRQKADDWYRAVARTRLEPGGVIILIMTRWHERDLAGVLQDEQDKGGEQWTVLRLPALAEPDDPLGRAVGTALWPERFNEEALAKAQATLGSYWFHALYQQAPRPPEGMGKFRRSWFKVADDIPFEMWQAKKLRYW